jgi:hypothetical protein
VVLDSKEAMSSRRSSSSTSSDLTPCVFQMHLNYELMQDELREMQESINDFNTQIQAFMAVRNKNTFIAFLTFSDIYVCFTPFALQTVVHRILDVAGIPISTWQPPPPRSRPIQQWSPWPSSGSSVTQVSYNLAKT